MFLILFKPDKVEWVFVPAQAADNVSVGESSRAHWSSPESEL